MTEIFDCKALELACRERAIADPQHRWKWLGQAERWKDKKDAKAQPTPEGKLTKSFQRLN